MVFFLSERAHTGGWGSTEHHEHLEQFNQAFSEQLTPRALSLSKPYRKLVAIRSPYNLGMLEKCLNETDPETTEVVVMTATVLPPAARDYEPTISDEDRHLLTAVVSLAEHAGKPVRPVIVPTNEPFYALAQTAKTIGAQELIMGPSNKYRPEDQLDAVRSLLVERLRCQARAAVDPRAGQGSRRAAGHRRRQPDSQAGRGRGRDRPDCWPTCARAGTVSGGCCWLTTAARSRPIFSIR